MEKIWKSEIPYDITSEIKFQLKIATDIWWTQRAFDKFNKRGYEKLTNITPCMPRFDIGIWIESQMNNDERRKYNFKEEYKFVPTLDIDETSKLNFVQPVQNWKYITKVI
jgi:hypothetical protein